MVGSGKTLNVDCTANGSPDPTISWYKDDAFVGDSGRVRALANGTLVVSRFSAFDRGTYKCQAMNSQGSDTENIIVDEAG